MKNPDKKKEYYFQVDLLRFASAFIVVLFHLGWSTWKSPTSLGAAIVQGSYTIPAMEPFAWWGSVGVEIFFVISGFVISGSAVGSTPIHFLKSRIERVYPALWICAPITAIIWLLSGVMPLGNLANRLIRSLALSPMGPWIDGPYWTLACEVFFYFLTFSFLLIKSRPRLEVFATVLTSYSIIFNILYFVDALGFYQLSWIHIFAKGTLKPLLAYYGVLFGLGMCLWLDRQCLLKTFGKIVAICAFIIGGMQVVLEFSNDPNHPWIIPFFAWTLSCLLMRWLHWSPGPTLGNFIRKLGLTTYPLYLLHFTLGVWIIRKLVSFSAPPMLALSFSITAVVILSYIVANHLEPKVKKVLRVILAKVDNQLQTLPYASFLYRTKDLNNDAGKKFAVHGHPKPDGVL